MDRGGAPRDTAAIGSGVTESRDRHDLARRDGVRKLRARIDELDAARYVSRASEDAVIAGVLDGSASVLYVHGPGGIGKSALLRELGRRGVTAGYRVTRADGRAFASDAGGLTTVLEHALRADRPLLLIDGYEWISALDGTLRTRILPALSPDARIVIASRQPPSPRWWEDGWDTVMTALRLTGFDDERARALLELHGILDEERCEALIRWADGLPLALVVGADVLRAAPDADLATRDIDVALADALLLRATGGLTDAQREMLEVASITPMIDARMLAATLPDVDADAGERWLRELAFAEHAGSRLRIHERLATAMRQRLRSTAPQREAELRRRIADELVRRARRGHPEMVSELINLVDDPAIHAAFGWGIARHMQIDGPRDTDAATIATRVGSAPWWPGMRRFFDEAPACVHVARTPTGEIAGAAIATSVAQAPRWVDEDVILGRWIAHARNRPPGSDVLLFRSTLDLTDGADPAVLSALNVAALQRSGPAGVRWIYGHADPDDRAAQELSAALGALIVPELEVVDGDRVVECHIVDHGPGGIVAAAHRLVYTHLGLPAPSPPATGARRPIDEADLRELLRSVHDPVALASSPVASGPSVAARADGVRRWLLDGLEAAFGPSDDEQLLRATIVRGYLDPDAGHQRAARDLHLSRSTYFRRLGDAVRRLAAFLADQDAPAPTVGTPTRRRAHAGRPRRRPAADPGSHRHP